ncbi:MAG: hypothetical protein SF097_00670 [Acidobacteriota bacterium]|nr:hypothetical protein [Acidobacteriota bacterium]
MADVAKLAQAEIISKKTKLQTSFELHRIERITNILAYIRNKKLSRFGFSIRLSNERSLQPFSNLEKVSAAKLPNSADQKLQHQKRPAKNTTCNNFVGCVICFLR